MTSNIFETDLPKTAANHVALSPISFIERAASVYPDYTAVVHGDVRRTWAETFERVKRMANALAKRGIGPGRTVSAMLANTPEMFELHFAVPMTGGVLNTINTRLDADTVGYILNHGEADIFMVDPEFVEIAKGAVARSGRDLLVVDVPDAMYEGDNAPIGATTYDALLREGEAGEAYWKPDDEWAAISLNYTSGTTGDPKGVVYHHRGAYLNALSNAHDWGMQPHPVYLWTLPMFHCNGWCYCWTLAALAGTAVCLRAVREKPILDLMRREKVTHFCGAPIVLNTLATAPDALKKDLPVPIHAMTAAAPPPAAVIKRVEAMGITVTHTYGLTETYGPAVVCAWKAAWNDLSDDERAAKKARQGVRYTVLEDIMVADPDTMEPVPHDGATIGEIFFRGNNVMRGYLKNPAANAAAFRNGWFASGDLAVMHEDNYIEIKDRSKDIIISGGENISSIEIESVLYRNPRISEAAVVARPDERWGETPCAFIVLKPGEVMTQDEVIAYCRQNMAKFKAPKTVIFEDLPKTSTGKVQKYVLRQKARRMNES
ncbi:acyl-CoA synthetase [Fulvimarina sp. 2208YS6-2-32]|uniref:Acyl-CoA synthetase n=1 Tax=Fulvimarina uroteuthidis TaxID=3098149 RepID=A0ABU5I3N9_9HYPH|nr:acyl-CoA synthetase [Fulvimarina sp. 2208YS6-2-32]MDY8109995.1 acyl-CoA synthetase [Fulvimarina sp. 2208YS6-2-32]